MQYDKAVNQLLDVNAAATFLMYVIAGLVLFILIGQAIKMWKDVFKKPKQDNEHAYENHLSESNKRFEDGEKLMHENRDAIRELREGFRVLCISQKALLNHAIHNGNKTEMEEASSNLDHYLINRK